MHTKTRVSAACRCGGADVQWRLRWQRRAKRNRKPRSTRCSGRVRALTRNVRRKHRRRAELNFRRRDARVLPPCRQHCVNDAAYDRRVGQVAHADFKIVAARNRRCEHVDVTPAFVAGLGGVRNGQRVGAGSAGTHGVVVRAKPIAALRFGDALPATRTDADLKRIERGASGNGQPVTNFAANVGAIHKEHRHGHARKAARKIDADRVTTLANPVHRDEHASRAHFARGCRWTECRAIVRGVCRVGLKRVADGFVVVREGVDFRTQIFRKHLGVRVSRQDHGTRHE